MTRDYGHSTGDDQRLQTYGGGGLVPEFDRYPLPLSQSCPPTLPPRSVVGHVTGPRRLRGHSQSAVLLYSRAAGLVF
ncbi:unnamed protein product [Staurois parvus]|uniref:Uncharacterized protein n=1 Tax=Staurois parvus TaxID=386267 RepID=A0ABN9CMZ0_9NEOB|nr:unnamed protein product [Staurois parvus]